MGANGLTESYIYSFVELYIILVESN